MTTDQRIVIAADQRLVRTPLAVDPSQPLRLAAEVSLTVTSP